jgi:hypothetical protein
VSGTFFFRLPLQEKDLSWHSSRILKYPSHGGTPKRSQNRPFSLC